MPEIKKEFKPDNEPFERSTKRECFMKGYSESEKRYKMEFQIIKTMIDAYFESEKERPLEEAKGLMRRDGGPLLCAYSVLKRIKHDCEDVLLDSVTEIKEK